MKIDIIIFAMKYYKNMFNQFIEKKNVFRNIKNKDREKTSLGKKYRPFGLWGFWKKEYWFYITQFESWRKLKEVTK